jgi:urease accessory protein
MPADLTSLLLLADSRLPAGAHAHSGGLEAAVAAGRVHDVSTLDAFLRGRLATAGLVGAAFAAAACARAGLSTMDDLDAALDVRTPSAALRRTSRVQGRSLLRAGRALWTVAPSRVDPHHSVALGLVAAAAGVSPAQAAGIAAYQAVSGPASAAVRLLGLDPYEVHALLARTASACDETAAHALERAQGPVDGLPAASAPLLDIVAEHHATWEVRLFAS